MVNLLTVLCKKDISDSVCLPGITKSCSVENHVNGRNSEQKNTDSDCP